MPLLLLYEGYWNPFTCMVVVDAVLGGTADQIYILTSTILSLLGV